MVVEEKEEVVVVIFLKKDNEVLEGHVFYMCFL